MIKRIIVCVIAYVIIAAALGYLTWNKTDIFDTFVFVAFGFVFTSISIPYIKGEL
jgi:hypothetical protein